MTDKTRREFLKTLGTTTTAVSLSTLPVPTLQQPPSVATAALRQQFGRLGFKPDSQLKQYSNNRVGVHIPYTEGNKSALTEWLNASDDRTITAEHDALRSITAQLPVSDLASGLASTAPIDEPDFIDEAIGVDAELTMSIPEPVDLAETPAVPEYSGLSGIIAGAFGFSLSASNEVAQDDAEPGTVAEARDVTGAPDTLVDAVDTSQITVAVIDTGLNTAGGSLLGSESRVLDASKNMLTGETVADQGVDAVADGQSHGSHVASTIAADPTDSTFNADYRGFLPSCDLLILKALGDDGSGSTAAIADAVTYAADQGADLLCMSLGSPLWSVQLDRALEYANGAGSIPFVAAGNNRSLPNPTPFINSPGDSKASIAVAAGEVRPASETRGGSFSAVGPDPGTTDASNGATEGTGPDIASTGVKLTALTPGTTGSLNEDTKSGTSMATPSAVGAAGLILAETGVSGREEMETRIEEYAKRAPRMGVEEAGAGWMHAEQIIDGTAPDQTQKEARNDEAGARDESWRALSRAYGRSIARRLL